MYPTQSRRKVDALPWSRQAAAFLRWRLRGLLRMLPARPKGPSRAPGPPRAPGSETASVRKLRIAYLFSGTYGDFVQVLRPLNRLASAFPRADLILWGGRGYLREFAAELPSSLRPAGPSEPWKWLLDPVDLLFVNCVGVYRTRFDFVAAFGARSAYGFRHSHEADRGGFTLSRPLAAEVRSFAEENMKLLDMAGVPDIVEYAGATRGGESPGGAGLASAPAWGKGEILFLIGSAGLKRDFGLETYARLVTGILDKLAHRQVKVVAGPGDEDIAMRVRAHAGLEMQSFPLSGLIPLIRSFEGTILCFNSFSAHICHYLGRPAIVLHREKVPYGYDCGPLHRQIVLRSERQWDPEDLWKALE